MNDAKNAVAAEMADYARHGSWETLEARLAARIAAAEERGRRRGVEEATARLAVWDDHLRAVGSVHACERLLEAAKAAYEHLDSFGVVAGGTPREHESQRRAFDMLRPFVTRALAPRDSGKENA